jgi:hypothetical protein
VKAVSREALGRSLLGSLTEIWLKAVAVQPADRPDQASQVGRGDFASGMYSRSGPVFRPKFDRIRILAAP